jgi:hypothetical protein
MGWEGFGSADREFPSFTELIPAPQAAAADTRFGDARLLGLMRAYWVSDHWREAWALTAVIVTLTALSSKAGVLLAEASGEHVNSIAHFHGADNPRPLASLLANAGALVLLAVLKDDSVRASLTGGRRNGLTPALPPEITTILAETGPLHPPEERRLRLPRIGLKQR